MPGRGFGASIAVIIGAVVFSIFGGCSSDTDEKQAPVAPDKSEAKAIQAAEAPEPVEQAAPVEVSIESPLDLTPSKFLLCWKGLPFPGAEDAPQKPSSLHTLLELAGRIWSDRLEDSQKLSMRILETLGIVGHYPFTVTLIDATAKPTREDGTGAKLDELRIAAVIRTGSLEESQPFLNVIQKAINELTDAGAATLTSVQVHGQEYQTLTDTRLPGWCEIAWGQIDEYFVLTFGQDVWSSVAEVAAGKQESLSRVEWVEQIRRQSKDEPLIEVLVSSDEIRRRLDPFVGERATAFFKAWHIEDVEYMHWSLGFKGRALYCLAYFREGGILKRRLFANPHIKDERFLQAVPDDARYAIYKMPAQRFLPKLISSYYATRDADDRLAATEAWEKIQTNLGIDAERDVLGHLGDHIVAHNYPVHPFNLPLAFTSLIEIKDEPEKVQDTLEKLLVGWQEMLDERATETGRPCPFRILHDDDGIWHLEVFMIHGVAWTFTDRYIVTSWSPIALRDYLETIGDKIGIRGQ